MALPELLELPGSCHAHLHRRPYARGRFKRACPSGNPAVRERTSAALRRVGLKLRTPSRASVAFIRLTMRVRSPTRHSNSDKRSEPGFDGWDRPLVRRPYWSLHDSSLEGNGFEPSVPGR